MVIINQYLKYVENHLVLLTNAAVALRMDLCLRPEQPPPRITPNRQLLQAQTAEPVK